MRTFSIQTLGCKVNQYESEQLISLLRDRGLVQVDPESAELRIINTCSVTMQAASKSRQTVRRATRLPVLEQTFNEQIDSATSSISPIQSFAQGTNGSRVIVTGCWATSDRAQAASLPGVDAVLTHHDDIAAELDRLLQIWNDHEHYHGRESGHCTGGPPLHQQQHDSPPEPFGYDCTNDKKAGAPVRSRALIDNKPRTGKSVKKNLPQENQLRGTRHLPLLGQHYTGQQRAFLKIQDGCDAHCTYCIIPQLRPTLWSKSINDAVEEARRLVDAGHVEIVLTGIFLGAYGQWTALRRRQGSGTAQPLTQLVEALCTRVRGLRRLRLSSLEPGDLTPDLIAVLRSHVQVMPHFHLPLQSGSDLLLRAMNRQYTRGQFLRMVDEVKAGFDRPAITTDIIVGFPGETDAEFAQTLEVVDQVGFIHTHAFPFSPRPGTAAARWTDEFIHGPVVNERINLLHDRARQHSLAFRGQFLGEAVEVLVEQPKDAAGPMHGRCERYFDVHFHGSVAAPGDAVRLRVERVTPQRTWGQVI